MVSPAGAPAARPACQVLRALNIGHQLRRSGGVGCLAASCSAGAQFLSATLRCAFTRQCRHTCSRAATFPMHQRPCNAENTAVLRVPDGDALSVPKASSSMQLSQRAPPQTPLQHQYQRSQGYRPARAASGCSLTLRAPCRPPSQTERGISGTRHAQQMVWGSGARSSPQPGRPDRPAMAERKPARAALTTALQ